MINNSKVYIYIYFFYAISVKALTTQAKKKNVGIDRAITIRK